MSTLESEHNGGGEVGSRQRWLAAIAYLGPLALYSMTRKGKSPFLRKHCQQGFALFLAEAAVVCFLLIISNTIGRIPILGFLIEILLELVAFLGFLVLTLLGFVRGLAGEPFRLPVIDEWADRIPVGDEDEDVEDEG